MSNSMKIFQLYFKDEQQQFLDTENFVAYDNTANPRPELREWYIWDKEYENCVKENLDYWGFVSWKFTDKTGITGEQFVNYIKDNPGYDVYFINPCLINEAVFLNSWEQGDIHHAGISNIGNKFFEKLGYKDITVRDMVLDRKVTTFANYVVGSREFWNKFMKFSRQLFTEADKDPVFKDEVFGAGRSNYAHDPSLPNFTFLIERLIPTFLDLEGFRTLPYQYNSDTLLPKYHPYAADMEALSNLKVLINQYESDDLYYIWNHYRMKFLKENPGILNLE